MKVIYLRRSIYWVWFTQFDFEWRCRSQDKIKWSWIF